MRVEGGRLLLCARASHTAGASVDFPTSTRPLRVTPARLLAFQTLLRASGITNLDTQARCAPAHQRLFFVRAVCFLPERMIYFS